VSIYRTALPVFASADTAARAISKAHGQEVSGPILRKIQTVSRLASPSPNPAPTPAPSPSPPPDGAISLAGARGVDRIPHDSLDADQGGARERYR
jgi:hypothetical protein